MIKKNMLLILSEAAQAEKFYVNESGEDEYSGYCDDDAEDIDIDDLSDEEIAAIQADILDDYDDMEEVEDDELDYTEEMVTVIANEAGNYFVEYDNLAKLMESAKCDAATAMQKIAECNKLEMANMRLVVESADDLLGILQEKAISKKARKKKVFQMKSSSTLLKDIKNKGITVVKRKSRKGKSKKRK